MARFLAVAFVFAIAACGGGGGGGGGGGDDDTSKEARHLYVASQFDRAIYVYDIAKDGSFSGPSRSITGPNTGLTNPISMIIDGQGLIYVVNYESDVVAFEADATGDAKPRTTFDAGINPVYIANNGSSGYALIANRVKGDASQATTYLGSIYPSPVVPGTFVSFEIPFIVPYQRSIATSPSPNLIGWSVWTCSGVISSGSGSVSCYGNPVTSNEAGYVTSPQFSLPGSPNSLAFLDDGALVVANQNAYMAPSNITIWSLPGEGNTTPPATPRAKIVGDATLLVSPVHVFVDDATDTIYVADTGNASYQGSIKTYPATADGNVAPTHIISGLNYPFAIAVGP